MSMNLRKIVTAYPGGLEKAFTMSYDDGNDCDIPLVEMMRRYGVKGTFNINSGCCPPERMPHGKKPWSRLPLRELIDLYGDDMEIAVHGLIHPTWDRLPSPNAMQDILDDRRELERATGKIIRGAAYPYGTYSDAAVEAWSASCASPASCTAAPPPVRTAISTFRRICSGCRERAAIPTRAARSWRRNS